MAKLTSVLVTGCGAIIGYGIIRSLREKIPNLNCVASDIYSDAAGQNWADSFEKAPYTSDPDYSGWLERIIERHEIDLIIPGIEQDVTYLAEASLGGRSFEAKLALNRPGLILMSRDKLAMDRLLISKNLPCRIKSLTEGSFDELVDSLGLPFLMKPRFGYASKGIVTVNNKDDFVPLEHRLGKFYLAQAYVGEDDEEYTVSVFCDAGGSIRAHIALRRTLGSDGATAKARFVPIDPFLVTLEDLCKVMQPEGPTNFQFRQTHNGPKLLEVNPRISSSTSIRTAFGMNEAAMCVDHYCHNKVIEQPKLKPGLAVRYIEDLVSFN